MPGKFTEAWKALEKLYKEQRIRAIGVCNCMQHHIEEILNICEIPPMVNQVELHPRLIQKDLVEFCNKKAIQVEAWSPLMRGRIFEIPLLKELAEKYNKTIAQLVIRWNLQKAWVTIPKSIHKDRIVENADVFNFEISEEDIQKIDNLDRKERTGAHPDHFLEHFNQK